MKKKLLISLLALCATSSMAKDLEAIEKSGDILQVAIPLTAAAISYAKDDNEGVIQVVEGALYTAAATQILKYTIDAERPNGGSGSMPSGHTSAATQGAAYLQFRYGWEYGVPAYIAAGWVGYTRVETDHHYWRDVVAGAALATAIQYGVTEMGYSVTDKFAIAPYFTEDEKGLYASLRF